MIYLYNSIILKPVNVVLEIDFACKNEKQFTTSVRIGKVHRERGSRGKNTVIDKSAPACYVFGSVSKQCEHFSVTEKFSFAERHHAIEEICLLVKLVIDEDQFGAGNQCE